MANGRVHVGSLTEFDAKGFCIVEHEGRDILVVRSEGEFFAVDNECPHMGSQLERGQVEGGRIICPWHRATFELRSGKSLSLFASDLRSYPVLVEADELYLVTDRDRGR